MLFFLSKQGDWQRSSSSSSSSMCMCVCVCLFCVCVCVLRPYHVGYVCVSSHMFCFDVLYKNKEWDHSCIFISTRADDTERARASVCVYTFVCVCVCVCVCIAQSNYVKVQNNEIIMIVFCMIIPDMIKTTW